MVLAPAVIATQTDAEAITSGIGRILVSLR
jgi:hypothetical protein